MTSLTHVLKQLATVTASDQDRATRQLYREAVMVLLRDDPFYGRVLSQLTVQVGTERAPLALLPTEREWQLQVNPTVLVKRDWTGAEWLAMLRHTVLHLLWQHPDRYATALRTPAQAGLARWATDAAVNDYLTDLPAGAITSRDLEHLLGQPVAARQDSAVYFKQLRAWQAQQALADHTHGTGGPQQTGDRVTREATADPTTATVLDGHDAWRSGSVTTQAVREQWRQQVLTQTAESLTAKQRGTLPGAIQAALKPIVVNHPLDWRTLLKRGLGQVPAGRQAAYGRFNRRQPARMELPGQIVATWQRLSVFVDESGSMGDQEVAYLLGQLAALLAVYPAQVTVYPFDASVHLDQRFTLEKRPQRLVRTGGGGTVFQAVLDSLPRLLTTTSGQLVLILTDGYGEQRLRPTLPVPIIWLLTSPADQFSVKDPPGTVISLSTDPQWQALRRSQS
ncbi:hypothetical protein IV54_GL000954 [Levilactobacillus paucivorans]|uniref:VWA-like domain-containing protein n=1 Tax=Levilactobacillus paucivorans TaxID=616990 RepID=A0A0R2L8U5_9LACO|nr:VWA-like domain-containing protein [Levilactobacillus paucivorans]KRN98223.1 hypothetical protein IV54_GL000954 [Levilactobacillus paucivorans]